MYRWTMLFLMLPFMLVGFIWEMVKHGFESGQQGYNMLWEITK